MRTSSPAEGYVTLGDLRVRYLSQGSGERVVMLVHGLADFAEEWLLTMESLASRFRVLAIDLPGHGGSDMPRVQPRAQPRAPYTPAWYARVMRDFLVRLDVRRASLVGRSLGGGLCLQTALDYPELCERLALLAPAGLGRSLGLWLRFLSLPGIGELVMKPRSRASGRTRPRPLPPAVPPETAALMQRKRLEARASPGTIPALLATIRSSVTILGLRSSLVRRARVEARHIVVPTLLIWGDRDSTIPVEHGRRAAAELPHARLVIIPDCGHDIHLEHPEETNRLLLEFLTQPVQGA